MADIEILTSRLIIDYVSETAFKSSQNYKKARKSGINNFIMHDLAVYSYIDLHVLTCCNYPVRHILQLYSWMCKIIKSE